MKKIFLILITILFTSNAIAEGNKFKSKDIKGFKKIRISMHILPNSRNLKQHKLLSK